MKISKLSPLFCLFILTCANIVDATPNLILKCTTDKPFYSRRELVHVYGNLTLGNLPVTNGLVSILVKNPNGNYILIRTVNTGTNPQNPLVEVRSVYLCDLNGNPKPEVTKGSLAYFKTTLSNYDVVTHNVLATIDLYDKNNTVLCLVSSNLPIPARSTTSFIISAGIPSWASSGTATVFASVLTDWPENGGTPYCPEMSASFTIADRPEGSKLCTPNGNQGNYNLTFRLPPRCPVGTYVVYSTSRYNGITALNSVTFLVKQPGDFDGDGDVDYKDIFIFIDTYIAYWAQNPWNNEADLDYDGDVDYLDVFAFVDAYIRYWRI